MNCKQKKVEYFGKQYLIVWFLLFSLQALRCGQAKILPGSNKGMASKIIALDTTSFKDNLSNQNDISKISGDILHTALRSFSKDKMSKIQLILSRIDKDLQGKNPRDVYGNTGFPNAFDKDGNTPLMVAIAKHDIGIIKLLMNCSFIEMNSQNSITGATPLHLLARGYVKSEDLPLIDILIGKLQFEDCIVKDKKNRTALYLAARFKNQVVFQAILEKIRNNFRSKPLELSAFLKKALLEKDDKNTSVLCRVLMNSSRSLTKVTAKVSSQDGSVRMFNKFYMLVKGSLNENDLRELNSVLKSEIDTMLTAKVISAATSNTLNGLLQGNSLDEHQLSTMEDEE